MGEVLVITVLGISVVCSYLLALIGVITIMQRLIEKYESSRMVTTKSEMKHMELSDEERMHHSFIVATLMRQRSMQNKIKQEISRALDIRKS